MRIINIFKLTLFSVGFLNASRIYSQTQDSNCKTDTTVFIATYNGKNLAFVSNPAKNNLKIKAIYVDNQEIKIKSRFSNAYELKLSELKIKTGHSFKLKLILCEMDINSFKIVNPEAISPYSVLPKTQGPKK